MTMAHRAVLARRCWAISSRSSLGDLVKAKTVGDVDAAGAVHRHTPGLDEAREGQPVLYGRPGRHLHQPIVFLIGDVNGAGAVHRHPSTGRAGVAAIGIAQEFAPVFTATKKQRGKTVWFSFAVSQRRVTCYYFYVWDDDFGPAGAFPGPTCTTLCPTSQQCRQVCTFTDQDGSVHSCTFQTWNYGANGGSGRTTSTCT